MSYVTSITILNIRESNLEILTKLEEYLGQKFTKIDTKHVNGPKYFESTINVTACNYLDVGIFKDLVRDATEEDYDWLDLDSLIIILDTNHDTIEIFKGGDWI